MIDLKELMDGDWIMWLSDAKENSFPMQFKLEEIEEIKRYGLKRFEYIELTEEILLNNGFTKCFDDVVEFDFYEDSHNNITMCNNSFMLNTNNKWNIHIDNRDMDSIMTCELTYVHELQRILKHVKIDKQIKLEQK